MITYRSNGKLLLTGEYAVLDGALSLAVPTKFGQSLSITPSTASTITWRSIDANGTIWFEEVFDISAIRYDASLTFSNDISQRLVEIFRAVLKQNPKFFDIHQGLTIATTLEFDKNWGLGSSSTLINNIATWAKIDAYKLLQDTFGGSGYDIACAQHDSPIFYQLLDGTPKVTLVDFDPTFKNHLYFVYLNKKQNSRAGIENYKKLGKINAISLDQISAITKAVSVSKTLEDFNTLLDRHETIIGDLVHQKPIKDRLFKDFDGSIKSLGAWGGDFILVSSQSNPKAYFKTKGFNTIIPYTEMVLK